jgi:anti-sigma-K factor RskA
MKPRSPELQEHLAREFALGTLPWRVRRRMRVLMKTEPKLRQAVADWENRLSPLGQALPDVEPPKQVWEAVQMRLGHRPVARGWWASIGFWRGAAALATVASLTLALLLAMPAPEEDAAQTMMVVVMEDLQTKSPAMTVAWEPGEPAQRRLRVRVIGHAEMAPDTAWELWMLPGGDKPPVSLGLITTHEEQTVIVPETLADTLDAASGLAMSVEPSGGSPTGGPTGPVLYAGQCVKV